MRCLIFTNTPAHVHLYKHVVQELNAANHEVQILARDYGCTTELLDYYDLPYMVYGQCGTSIASLFRRLPGHYARIVPFTLRFDPDLIFGMGSYSAHAGAVSRTPTFLVLDSEPTGLDHRLSVPFAKAILTPESFQKDLGDHHFVFAGFKECAYLHPDVYSSEGDIRGQLGLASDEEFVILRLNAFGSHHDVGKSGFSTAERHELIKSLSEKATVFVSDEGGTIDLGSLPARSLDLHPARIHDALQEAKLLVADSQTMVTEAALLGTPAIRSNAFVGGNDMGNFLELEEAGLIFNVQTAAGVIKRAEELLDYADLTTTWQKQRDTFMQDKVNLTDLLVTIAMGEQPLDEIEGIATRRQSILSSS